MTRQSEAETAPSPQGSPRAVSPTHTLQGVPNPQHDYTLEVVPNQQPGKFNNTNGIPSHKKHYTYVHTEETQPLIGHSEYTHINIVNTAGPPREKCKPACPCTCTKRRILGGLIIFGFTLTFVDFAILVPNFRYINEDCFLTPERLNDLRTIVIAISELFEVGMACRKTDTCTCMSDNPM